MMKLAGVTVVVCLAVYALRLFLRAVIGDGVKPAKRGKKRR